ncbi:rRNA-processing protein fcf2-like [Trifolium pratense]|uniref:rRNA-processing protein fcf2-like n=1 Tax=Trifolium pratense TaxID=57577 RepID=UPI0008457040|nr:rRNA-processing protein fcf2-like [Trifolium pratense]XP_045829298.1 rRNA-processing protein fcf2-like [Trifolium pratense]
MAEKKPVVGLSWQPQLAIQSMSKATYLPSHTKPQIEAPTSTLWKPNSELVNGLFVPPNDPRKVNKLLRQQVKDTLGKDWFDMPAQTITPELQRDWKLLKLRGVIDPKLHFKRSDSKNSKTLPKYFQMGTIVDSPVDYYTGRLTKRERKTSIAEEFLADQTSAAYRKRKVREIEEQRKPGGNPNWKIQGTATRKRAKERRKF